MYGEADDIYMYPIIYLFFNIGVHLGAFTVSYRVGSADLRASVCEIYIVFN